MITKILAVDRIGHTNEYDVRQEVINVDGFQGTKYMISRADISGWKYFEIQTLEIPPGRIMIYMLLNHDHPEFQEKGIVKAMLKALSAEFKIDIVSSTNIEELKINISEGRIDDMTKAWEKWKSEFTNIEWLEKEDRFIFKYVP